MRRRTHDGDHVCLRKFCCSFSQSRPQFVVATEEIDIRVLEAAAGDCDRRDDKLLVMVVENSAVAVANAIELVIPEKLRWRLTY